MTHRARIVIAPYDDRWPELFAAERSLLIDLFRPIPVRIEHIGSTSVPGLGAKPIVDIMLGADRLSEVERRIPSIVAQGYQYMPEFEAALPERRFFVKPQARPRAFHLHAVEQSSKFWERHLLFRDHLREHPETAAEYFALKVDLAAQFGDDRDGYTNAKTDFIEGVIRKARVE